ncbi:MAG TPA: hypothetical protein VL137_04175 [Polyangiaceae bacterium]|nr:hypothetical protein [Polyangiaceae bacterium]
MFGRILIAAFLTLFIVKVFFFAQWRRFKKRLDRAVNILLWVIGISYAIQLIVRFW